MVKKFKIYEIETKSYMIFDNKPSYIGRDVRFIKGTSKKNAENIYKLKYKNGEKVKHYTGTKKVIYDLKNLKVKRKKEYDSIYLK